MQIIQNIREKGSVIVIGVIALSLIGFIMMDSRTASSRSGSSSSVGKINGETIDSKTLIEKVKQLEDQRGGHVSGPELYQLRQSAWDQLVADKVLNTEFEKLGLVFSPKELSSILFSEDAPQTLKQAFTDKNTGMYDIEKAKQWWIQAKKSKGEQRDAIDAQIVEPLILQTLANKYSSLLAASAYYPTWMQEKENMDSKTFANISYVSIPYNVISDSTVKVSDDELLDYMSKHKNIYKQDGGRIISYVSFSALPSKADTVQTLELVTNLKASFSADTNAKAFVARNMSAINFEDSYTPKSKLAMTQKDSITALPNGAVFGPYLDGKNIVLAKMLGSRQLPDSVKCRHILIATKNSQTGEQTLSDSIAKKRIDSIETAIKGGEDFNKMVLMYSDDQGSKDKKGEYDFTATQFSTLAKEFAETIFYGAAGDKKVVKSDFGYHYIEVLSQKSFETAYKIAFTAKEILPSDETINLASEQATKLSGEARDGKALEAYVAKKGLRKIDIPTLIKENDYRLGSLQDARQLIKWAFEAKQGDVSEPFNIQDQFVVGVLDKIQPDGLPDAKTARPMVEQTVRNLKKADEIGKKLGATPTLESAAAAYKVSVSSAGADSTITFASQIINGVGQEPKLIGASFNKANQTKASELINGANGVYILKVNSLGNKAAIDPALMSMLASEKTKTMVQTTYSFFESLKKMADIKDNRSKIY
ncbi:peptidylprolyl isomerase [Ferruginibacter sp.]|uniref:peptidylprolyl isomerase n=1 Tax=Ferruginibacter sp. TaxID=1940288 RepID=UPI0019B45E89|nr:peptidylprolyl isomerase [Ferruginibacter sp.]MBC7626974.1 SurA N-terminal domain-containing protein [Ferruginibacter sp.]